MKSEGVGPQGNDLKQATYRLIEALQARLANEQGGIPTAFDRSIMELMSVLGRLDRDRDWEEAARDIPGREGASIREALVSLRALHHRHHQGRYVPFSERLQQSRSDIPARVFAFLNGVDAVVRWKGIPLFKSPFDVVLLQMLLWEVRPATIVEIGSGLGASAAWLGDLLDAFGLAGNICSFDLKPPRVKHPRVQFLAGDVHQIADDFPSEILRGLQHPVLLIEDAHANLPGIFEFFHPYLAPGDYLFVEDSADKADCLAEWLARTHDAYLVDTRYVDFFGQNATFARDSIFVRV